MPDNVPTLIGSWLGTVTWYQATLLYKLAKLLKRLSYAAKPWKMLGRATCRRSRSTRACVPGRELLSIRAKAEAKVLPFRRFQSNRSDSDTFATTRHHSTGTCVFIGGAYGLRRESYEQRTGHHSAGIA